VLEIVVLEFGMKETKSGGSEVMRQYQVTNANDETESVSFKY
jgi:hypothetical protein